MKCPNDKTEMEKGGFTNNGNLWRSDVIANIGRVSFIGGKVVFAYCCPKCGKVELTTEVK